MVEGGPCINPTFNVVDSLVGMTKTHLHTFNMLFSVPCMYKNTLILANAPVRYNIFMNYS